MKMAYWYHELDKDKHISMTDKEIINQASASMTKQDDDDKVILINPWILTEYAINPIEVCMQWSE